MHTYYHCQSRCWRFFVWMVMTVLLRATGRALAFLTSSSPLAPSSRLGELATAMRSAKFSHIAFAGQRKAVFAKCLHRELCRSSYFSASEESSADADDQHRRRILDAASSDDNQIVEDTLDWLQHVVMGFNLCPFARPSFVKDQIYVEVVHGENPTDILAQVVEECWKLKRDDIEGGTTLVVCPDLFPEDFEEFLGILNILEEGILEDLNLSDDLQIAPFHPLFVFGDQEVGRKKDDAISSYTNRAPYPVFHILREIEVSKAVEALEGDASKVWKRNIELLQLLDDEFSGDTRDGAESDSRVLRSTILKGKIRKHVDSEKVRQNIQERIQRAMKKFKKERLTNK